MTTITLTDIIQTMDEPVSDLPLKTIIDAYFDGTKRMHDFGREVMTPQLKTLLGPTAQEIALGDTYFKMHLLLGSALAMNRLDHFQSVAALTRSLWDATVPHPGSGAINLCPKPKSPKPCSCST